MSLSPSLKSPEPRIFSGSHVTLVPLDAERDSAELFRISHCSEEAKTLWQYMPNGPYSDAESMKVFLKNWRSQPDALPFTVQHATEKTTLGTLSLMSLRPEHGVAEIGHVWYAPEAQRSKANTESTFLLLRYCFEELGYRRMEWKCNNNNQRSRRAALRMGFSYEGLFRQHMIVKGENRDTAWFSMLDHEWPRMREAFSQWLYRDDSIPLHELTGRLGENLKLP